MQSENKYHTVAGRPIGFYTGGFSTAIEGQLLYSPENSSEKLLHLSQVFEADLQTVVFNEQPHSKHRDDPLLADASKKADNQAKMNGPTREEIDAKLQAVEARIETRVTDVLGKIDSLLVSQQGLDRLYQKQFSDLASAQAAQKVQAEEAKQEQLRAINEAQKSSADDIKSLKRTIAVAGIGTALTVVFGIAAFNATLLSNMIASFESGKNTMQSVNQVTNQLNETAKKLADIEAKLEAQKAVATQPAPTPSPEQKPKS